ncbi:PLP-dependent transferase [Phanerochaete sordida]|uniref:PLP-dependent transferase n=1 Tax=Phanerochaete sordida TaxID=48140 RepID=A0A9P3G695_9APHY|nr:PLP-dependent transferase [Phanerochaete sordida]
MSGRAVVRDASKAPVVLPSGVLDPEGSTYDPSAKPPPFGRALRKFWGFEETYVNVNHGSYGSLPLPVLAQCNRLSLLAEANPDRFHRSTYMPMLADARKQIAELVGAEHDEIVIVPNTTHGLNTILRNIEWRTGDIVLTTTVTYNAVERSVQYLADRAEGPHPTAHTLVLTYPTTHAEIVAALRAKLRALKAAAPAPFDIAPGDSDSDVRAKHNRLVVVLDAIVSVPGAAMPWVEMVRVIREEGAWSVVDAAHSLGQELNINLGEAQPDFWVSNCHKWLYVKRGCAALYVPKRNQHLIKASVPTSHAYPGADLIRETGDTNFVEQHEWTGTQDFIPYLSIPHALAFRKWLGGEDAINGYCHKLAREGGQRLATILGTRVLDASGEATLCMTNVQLPLPVEETGPNANANGVYTPDVRAKLSALFANRFLNKYNTHPGTFFHAGAVWCRISVQVWTEMADFEYVGKALNEICKEARETILGQEVRGEGSKL